MLFVNYEAPNGTKRHNRLWNGGNGVGILRLYEKGPKGKLTLVDEMLAENIGCEFGEYDKEESAEELGAAPRRPAARRTVGKRLARARG